MKAKNEAQKIEQILRSYQSSTIKRIKPCYSGVGLQNLPKKLKGFASATIMESVNKLILRNENNAQITLSYKDKLREKLSDLADCLPSSGYSMGELKKLSFEGLKIYGSFNNKQEYARSSKYRATHGHIESVINRKFRHAQNLGGLITLVGEKRSQTVNKCVWVDFNTIVYRGKVTDCEAFEIKGYISFIDAKRPFHAVKYSDILEYEKRIKERFSAERARAKELKKESKAKLANLKFALKRLYSYSDSLECGNCTSGTKAFIMRLGLDENKKYKGAFLVKLANEKSVKSLPYIERMLNHFNK